MRVRTWIAASAVAAGMLGAGMAQAAVVWTADNGLSGDSQLKAEADLSLSGNILTITLINELANNHLRDQGQAISGLDLVFEDPFSLPTMSGSGDLVNFNNSATPVDLGTGSLTHWGASLAAGALRLTALTHATPDQLIINDSTSYSHTNTGFQHGHFNPYVKGPATFVLNFGSTPISNIKSLTFEFGTGPDATVGGSCSGSCDLVTPPPPPGVPEPATWAVMLLGFFALGAMLRRRSLAAA